MAFHPHALREPEALLPDHLNAHLWRGHRMNAAAPAGWSSGFSVLDAELPGGGWPLQALTEILQTPHACATWRLLAPALSRLTQAGGMVFLIAPPQQPHLPGLAQRGLPAHQLCWVRCESLAERLWATEQALKAPAVSAILSWLPFARSEHMRRLHACAARHRGLFFALRPASAAQDASAAPLRLMIRVDAQQADVQVELIKRRGPVLDRVITLPQPDLPGLRAPSPSAVDALPVLVPPSPPRSPGGQTMDDAHHAVLDRLVLG